MQHHPIDAAQAAGLNIPQDQHAAVLLLFLGQLFAMVQAKEVAMRLGHRQADLLSRSDLAIDPLPPVIPGHVVNFQTPKSQVQVDGAEAGITDRLDGILAGINLLVPQNMVANIGGC